MKLKRFDGYKPNTSFQDRTGLGGFKLACIDSVTFRIVTEPGARVAGLRTGEFQAVEDLPASSIARTQAGPEYHRPAAEELVDTDGYPQRFQPANG